MKTKLMVTNLVHLQNAITEPCVPEEVSRVLRSSKRWWWSGGRGWCWARAREKNDLKDIMDGGSGCFSFLLLHFADLQLP